MGKKHHRADFDPFVAAKLVMFHRGSAVEAKAYGTLEDHSNHRFLASRYELKIHAFAMNVLRDLQQKELPQ